MVPIESSSVSVSPRHQTGPEGGASGTVVWLRGEHDASTSAALSDTIGWAMALDDTNLMVDLSGVQFMSTATLGVIVEARVHLGRRSRSLAVRAPSRCARRLLDLCGLADLVDPRPATTTGATATTALSMWVAVPVADRAGPVAEAVPTADLVGPRGQ